MSDAEEGDAADVGDVRDRMDELRADPDEEPQPTESTGGEDDDPEPHTFEEVLGGDEEYPWESEEGVVEDANGEREQTRFEYLRIPFEITEPVDSQKVENARRVLEDVGDAGRTGRNRMVKRYMGKLKDIALTVDGTPIGEVFAVDRPDGQRDVLTWEVAAKHGLLDADGEVNRRRAHELGVEVAPLWDALSDFQRSKIGQKMDRFLTGEGSFRPRFRDS